MSCWTALQYHSQDTDIYVVVVRSLSHVWLFVTPWTGECQFSMSFTLSWSLLKFMSIESVMLSNHLIVCHPLLLLPSIFPSVGVFSSESALCIRWPAYWSFSISPVNIQGWFPLRFTGLISLQSKGLWRVFSSTIVQKHQFSVRSLLYGPVLTSVHDYWKNHSFD